MSPGAGPSLRRMEVADAVPSGKSHPGCESVVWLGQSIATHPPSIGRAPALSVRRNRGKLWLNVELRKRGNRASEGQRYSGPTNCPEFPGKYGQPHDATDGRHDRVPPLWPGFAVWENAAVPSQRSAETSLRHRSQ